MPRSLGSRVPGGHARFHVAKSAVHLQPLEVLTAGFAKVIFVTDGWARVAFGGSETVVGPGSILVVPERTRLRGEPHGFVRTVTVHLQTTFLESQQRWLPTRHPVVRHLLRENGNDAAERPIVMHLDSRAVQILRPKLALLEALSEVPCREFAIIARVADLMDDVGYFAVQRSAAATFVSDARPVLPREPVAEAARVLLARLDYSWSVQELARAVALSESQLTRLFRQDLGMSPAAFLWSARADRMAEFLAASDQTIAQAARSAGWASPSAASRAFKRRYGVSPRGFVVDVRRAALQDPPPPSPVRLAPREEATGQRPD